MVKELGRAAARLGCVATLFAGMLPRAGWAAKSHDNGLTGLPIQDLMQAIAPRRQAVAPAQSVGTGSLDAISRESEALYRKIAPAVLKILILEHVTERQTTLGDYVPELRPKKGEFFRPANPGKHYRLQVIRSTKEIANFVEIGSGSGVVIDPRGMVVTNVHVADIGLEMKIERRLMDLMHQPVPPQVAVGVLPDGTEVPVYPLTPREPSINMDEIVLMGELSDGQLVPLLPIAEDGGFDLALLRAMTPEVLPAVALGDSDALVKGQMVFALGAPQGQSSTFTQGIVSALHQRPDDMGKMGLGEAADLIQLDAPIDHGSSGGGLFDTQGRLVGITESMMSQTQGFAVPVNQLKLFLAEAIASASAP